jgi:hypothetical protein
MNTYIKFIFDFEIQFSFENLTVLGKILYYFTFLEPDSAQPSPAPQHLTWHVTFNSHQFNGYCSSTLELLKKVLSVDGIPLYVVNF